MLFSGRGCGARTVPLPHPPEGFLPKKGLGSVSY